jgi:ribosome-associated toxin RatA of RatAB toxin-antitoxin module
VGLETAHRSIEIAATPAACFDVVADFEAYPSWQPAVDDVRVLEHDSNGRGTLVETVIDARIKKVRYVLAYSYEEPFRVAWDLVEGDPKAIEGDFAFETGDGVTVASYRMAADLGGIGRFVPGEMRRRATEYLMKSTVEGLKARVERGA